jgi:hypothetical protein
MASLPRSISVDSLDNLVDKEPKKEYPLFDATLTEASDEEFFPPSVRKIS